MAQIPTWTSRVRLGLTFVTQIRMDTGSVKGVGVIQMQALLALSTRARVLDPDLWKDLRATSFSTGKNIFSAAGGGGHGLCRLMHFWCDVIQFTPSCELRSPGERQGSLQSREGSKISHVRYMEDSSVPQCLSQQSST